MQFKLLVRGCAGRAACGLVVVQRYGGAGPQQEHPHAEHLRLADVHVVMRRTSARLRASGDYCPSNISYRENPVKVFKKRDGNYFNLPHGAKSATQAISYTPPIPAAQPPILAAHTYVNNSVSSRMKKTCCLLFVLILISLCVWLLFPVLTHLVAFKLPKFLPHQPNTHLDAAEEIKERMNLVKQDLIGLISSLGVRIKAMIKDTGVKPPAPSVTNNQLTPEIQQAMEKWLFYHIKEQDVFMLDDKGSGHSIADKMANFALEVQGARVISSRCSETYRGSREFLTLFGFTTLTVTVSPRTVIQGLAPLLPGRCWSFPGAEGTLAITLSHPVMITHVTVDHISHYISPSGSIKAAPKTFELYGMRDISEKRILLGTFTYNQSGESMQTFKLPNPTDDIYRGVEMHVLSNWGQAEYTCLYRFRVHGKIAST
ncbi:unnamed protein product [Pleuronectes platessa]|uniref:SUN domain-containing protein n=1 Tax=Pleuronectes platessa TaxID=8262 RepID=A0A9N7W5N1_PLEPL|nr:unnamed protein product [Pleuronectes platessa]